MIKVVEVGGERLEFNVDPTRCEVFSSNRLSHGTRVWDRCGGWGTAVGVGPHPLYPEDLLWISLDQQGGRVIGVGKGLVGITIPS